MLMLAFLTCNILLKKYLISIQVDDKKADDTTAGITSNNTKGLVIPPVKKISIASCVRSYVKYIVEIKSLNNFFFSLNCKKILVRTPKKITPVQ